MTFIRLAIAQGTHNREQSLNNRNVQVGRPNFTDKGLRDFVALFKTKALTNESESYTPTTTA